MAVGDFLGEAQKGNLPAQFAFGLNDGVAPQRRVGFHDLEFLGLQLARLEQDLIGNADLADVVQGRGLEKHFNGLVVVQQRGKARVPAQVFRQQPHIVLGAADMVAGLVVAGFGEGRQRVDGDILDDFHFPGAPTHLGFKKGVLVAQEVLHAFHGQVGLDPRQHDRRTDWLGDVVDRSELKSAGFVTDLGLGGQENDRNRPCNRVFLESLADFVTVHLRHHDVEQDQVGRCVRTGNRQGPRAAVGDPDPVGITQKIAHQGEIVGNVVDHQDAGLFVGQAMVRHDVSLRSASLSELSRGVKSMTEPMHCPSSSSRGVVR